MPSKLISLAIRIFQIIFSALTIAMAGAIMGGIGTFYARVNYILAAGAVSFVYSIVVLIPFIVNNIPLVVIFVFEIFITAITLAAFGVLADSFASLKCSGVYYDYYYYSYYSFDEEWCKFGKVTIAFTLITWLLFAASLTLFVIYTLVPQTRAGEFLKHYKNSLATGGIFPKYISSIRTAQQDSSDGVNEEERKDLYSSGQNPSTVPETQPAESYHVPTSNNAVPITANPIQEHS